jgi:hypothetical protein
MHKYACDTKGVLEYNIKMDMRGNAIKDTRRVYKTAAASVTLIGM